MTTTIHMLTIIILCGIVTWLTRIIPFVMISKVHLSERVVKWLSFIPITLFTALIHNQYGIFDNDDTYDCNCHRFKEFNDNDSKWDYYYGIVEMGFLKNIIDETQDIR